MHPRRYAVMLMVSPESYDAFDRTPFEPYAVRFMECSFVDGVAPPHVSLCYLSYPERYPRSFVERYEECIAAIISSFGAVSLEVEGFTTLDVSDGVVACWRILDDTVLRAMNRALVEELGSMIPHLREMPFEPHIGLALLRDEPAARALIAEPEARTRITFSSVMIYYPEGARVVTPHIEITNENHLHSPS
ncbi:MAG: 2'-5' RNA ligase family protein [Candidatus Woesearchaeota archaeon]